jgi:hypothetical protein
VIDAVLYFVYAGRNWARLTGIVLMLVTGLCGLVYLLEVATINPQYAKDYLVGSISLMALGAGYGVMGLLLLTLKSIDAYIGDRRSRAQSAV